MNILIILAHPDEKSFNAAIADTVFETLKQNNHWVMYHDLYREKFDPLITESEIEKGAILTQEVEKHCQELSQVDGIIIVHPNWWGQPPAILKGWIDRVIRPGVAYAFIGEDQGEGVPVGLLKAGTAIVFNTSNTNASREEKVFGDPLEAIWRHCIFGLCGIPKFFRKTFRVMVTSTLEERQGWLDEVSEIINYYFPKEGTPNDSSM